MQRTRLIPLAAAGALAASVLGSWTPAQADTTDGYVIGTVTDTAGRALPGASTEVFWCDTTDDGDPADADGCFGTSTEGYGYTDRSGRYVADVSNNAIAERAGDAGSWRVRAYKSDYTSPATTAAITVAARANNTAPTIVLTTDAAQPAPAGAVLTGLVTDAAGVPLADAYVEAYDATGDFVDGVSTGPDGRYYFTADNPADYTNPATYPESNVTGSVRLLASAPARLSEWSGDTRAKSKATAVPVAAYGSPTASAPTMALASAGSIAGSVKLPAAGANWGAYVTILDLDGLYVTQAETDAAGSFSTDVDPGQYLVRADGYRYTEESDNDPSCAACTDFVDSFGFVGGYYGGGTSLATAKPLTVASGATASAGTITLSNALAAVEKPEVKGKLKNGELAKGKKLTVTTGEWNRRSNVTYTYVWKVGSKVLSTTDTLKVTKKVQKKIGKKLNKLTVTVTATDVFGVLVDGSSTVKVRKALAQDDKGKDGKGKGGKK